MAKKSTGASSKAESKTKTAVKSTTASAKKAAVKKTPAKKTAVKKAAVKKTAVKKAAKPEAMARPKSAKSRKAYLMDDSLSLALAVAQGMYEKKASDIRILDLRHIPTASTEYFVISHAVSDKQVEAIAGSAEDYAFEHMKQWPWHREGYENCEWVLLDYVLVVAHVFKEDLRGFYGLEELWADGIEVPFQGK